MQSDTVPSRLPPRLRVAARAAIVLACAWHVFAVTAFALPFDAVDPFTTFVRTNITPHVEPYLFTVSQWQQWNAAAPEPTTRIQRYVIQQRVGEEWLTIDDLAWDTIPWWRKFTESRILVDLYNYPDVLRRYVTLYCETLKFPPGTELRMLYRYYLLPISEAFIPPRFWDDWSPVWQEEEAVLVACPA